MAGQAAAHAAVGGLDEAIKEYLLYRGFTQSLKWFEQERKDDKDKGFRVRDGLKLLANRLLGWGRVHGKAVEMHPLSNSSLVLENSTP